MLREIVRTSQKNDEPRKRWFSSLDMDLFIWLNGNNEIISYHLTYNKPYDEKALIWSDETGFSHLAVDEGTRPGKYPGSPLLVRDGVIKPLKIIAMFKKNAGELEPAVTDFIVSGIEAHY